MAEQRRRVVHGAFRGEQTPQTTETVVDQSLFATLVLSCFDLLTRYATEATVVALPVVVWTMLALKLSPVVASVVTGLLVIAVVMWKPARRFVGRRLHIARLRRRWESACRFAGLATHNDHVPGISRTTPTPVGDRLVVRIPSGSSIDDLEGAVKRISTCLEVREVRVAGDQHNARFATVDVVRTDPLATAKALAWPKVGASSLSLWDPIPVGVDELGETAVVSLPWRNILLGGEPGAGKSVALSQLVATAALDLSCDLTLLDGKQVELAPWASVARNIVSTSITEACDVLREVQSEMDQRYTALLDSGKRKVEPGDGNRLHMVVCDELAYYLTMFDRKDCAEFERLCRDLVARGRAAGIIVVAATQRPSHDIVSTSLRDLFAFRWALRCSTHEASDTILGRGWASEGFSAKTVDAAHQGVGYLRHEGETPLRMRSFCLADADIEILATRAASLRNPPPALSSVA